MTRWFESLNLRPQEQRLVVLSSLVLFLVLNLWFVWPHFGDLRRTRMNRERALSTLAAYQTELARTNTYQARLTELKEQGGAVLAEDQAIALMSTIQRQAAQSGIQHGRMSMPPRNPQSRTNEFFEEQTLDLSLNPTGPEEIVDFLVALTTGDLVIRVRELDLRPDPTQTRLVGSMKLVASFQKKPESGASRKTAAATAKPPRS